MFHLTLIGIQSYLILCFKNRAAEGVGEGYGFIYRTRSIKDDKSYLLTIPYLPLVQKDSVTHGHVY